MVSKFETFSKKVENFDMMSAITMYAEGLENITNKWLQMHKNLWKLTGNIY